MSTPRYDTMGFPLDAASPWPKFRANAAQNGRAAVTPAPNSRQPWVVRTGKGIFSSPVVDADGSVYIGSADHVFYAIGAGGDVKWTLPTGELIDSSALLDDAGRVYFASGDGFVYCVNRENGAVLWRTACHTVQEVEEVFGITTYNLSWFEGNVGMLPDGTVIAPNDNYIVYGLDRQSGERKMFFPANEMVWSLPAVDADAGRLFFGTCFMIDENLFCYDYKTGEQVWSAGALGAVSASPLLALAGEVPAVVVGCFDGMLRAYARADGRLLWQTGLRDHIYASPAQLSTGQILQPCTDGTLYCLHPTSGEILWTFDTREPIRSSPAVDGADQIYFGNGEGKLFCVNPDGTLRWWYQCITEPRSDMNASPALGPEGVVIAGESGEIFFVPYDYPLRAENAENPRCKAGPKGDLPDDGVFLLYTGPFGALRPAVPETLDPNAPLTFTLLVREGGRTLLAALNREDFAATTDSGAKLSVNLAANGRFVSVYPEECWTPEDGGAFTLTLKGSYNRDLEREGLLFYGGQKGGDFERAFIFKTAPALPQPFPYSLPQNGRGPATVLELCRQAVPLPTMMPSLNQIGFDSLHYLAGLVEKRGDVALLWVVSGKLEGKNVVFDAASAVRYPMLLRLENGVFTLYNYDGFKINFVGSWDMPFEKYRIATTLDGAGHFVEDATYTALCNCDDIEFYGPGLKLMGMSDEETGRLCATGGITLKRWGEVEAPAGLGDVTLEKTETGLVARLENSALLANAHVYSLLLTNAGGHPLPLYYTRNTHVLAGEDGRLTGVKLDFDPDENVGGAITAHLMVDTYPAYRAEIQL